MSPAMRPPDAVIRSAAGASVALHGLILASLLLSLPRTSGNDGLPPLVIELIQSRAMTQGDAPVQPQPPQQEGAGATAPPPPPPAPPSVNIGNGPEENDPLTVTGENIVPAEPNSKFHKPPRYPPDAARIGAEGVVQLVIHVSPQGIPLAVRIVQSSGNRSLDGEARRAVQLWRFNPALKDGQPVDFDYPINIRFALGDHP